MGVENLISPGTPELPLEDCVNPGDTAWVLLSAILVLGMMPALAFFEAGLLRRKNTLSIITEVFMGLAIMQFMWYFGGFSLVYGTDYGGFIGGLDYFFMRNLGNECLPNAPSIPGLAFASFQSMFASVTPLLMTGAIAERMRFRSFVLFIILWEILVYYPLAHWIWGGGFLMKFGVCDFAGGIVIHTSSGAASLVLAYFLGRRIDFHEHHGEPVGHNIPLAAIGTALLWMGWYGFNAGSALTAGPVAAYAISATTVASTVGVMTSSIFSIIRYGNVHTIAILNGAIAGMAGITPASGYIESYWAFIVAIFIVLGAYGGIWLFKEKLKIDDALDVSSVHGITGMIGSLSIGFIASSDVNPNGPDGWFYGNPSQIYIQLCGVLVAIAWSIFWTVILVFLAKKVHYFNLTVKKEIEILGLDYYYHGDVAYDSLETPVDPEIEKEIKEAEEKKKEESASDINETEEEIPILEASNNIPTLNIQDTGTSARPLVNAQTLSIPVDVRKTLSARLNKSYRI